MDWVSDVINVVYMLWRILLRRAPKTDVPVARVGSDNNVVVFLHGLRPMTSQTPAIIAEWDVGDATVIAPEIAYHECGITEAAVGATELVHHLTSHMVSPRILIVGHSMGGRVAMEMQRRMTYDNVRVITLGSPLQGTWATCLPLSRWFLGATAPLTPMQSDRPSLATCYYSYFDHMVRPSTATVKRAMSINAGLTTHWGLPTCVAVKKHVRRFCYHGK